MAKKISQEKSGVGQSGERIREELLKFKPTDLRGLLLNSVTDNELESYDASIRRHLKMSLIDLCRRSFLLIYFYTESVFGKWLSKQGIRGRHHHYEAR